jgi:hypothetical protein
LSVQGSLGTLRAPERLHPGIDLTRLTFTATYAGTIGPVVSHTTIGFGRNNRPRTLIPVLEARRTFPPPVLAHYLSLVDSTGIPSDSLILLFPARVQRALLLETMARWGPATLIARLEWAEKDELFPTADRRHSTVFPVGKMSLGYVQDVIVREGLRLGVGVAGSLDVLPSELRAEYGRWPGSYVVFTRVLLE